MSDAVEEADTIIDSIPVSWFHYRLLIITGLAFMADALEVSLLTFLSTCAGNEWGLSNLQRASIAGVVFSGELLGGIVWGPVADKYGRKIAFLFASSMIVIFGFLSGAANSYEILLFCRAMVGFGVGGLTVPFDLLAEFLPILERGKFLIYIEYFWTLGSLFVAGLAWVALDVIGWRGLSYLTAVPVALSSIAALIYLPESPRWLIVKGRYLEAEEIVRNAAAVSGTLLKPFSFSAHVRSESDTSDIEEHEMKASAEETLCTSFIDLVRTAQLRQISIPLWIIWTSFGFTYYGIILLVARLYTDPSTSVKPSASEPLCSFDYQSIFVNASAELLAVFLASLIIDISRTKTQGIFYTLGGVAVLLMGFKLPTLGLLPYVSMLARLGAMGASCATWVSTSELYPTEMRATGHSVCSSLAKVGSFIVPYFVISSVSLFTVGTTLACVNFLAASVAFFMLPETKGLKLDLVTENLSSLSGATTHNFRICPSEPDMQSTSSQPIQWTTNAIIHHSNWDEDDTHETHETNHDSNNKCEILKEVY